MDLDLTLKVNDLDVHYNIFQALWNVSMEVKSKEIVSIIGSNGSGKSTLLNTIAGHLTPSNGSIELFGERIEALPPHRTVPKGISLVPEGRRIFPRLTVYENLVMGAYAKGLRSVKDETMENIYELFPKLKERRNQMAATLSGGEQQMLAIGRAMMSKPKLILCDEISLGLAPVIIKNIYTRLEHINKEGISIILVEQDVARSLSTAHSVYVMLGGKVVLKGDTSALSEKEVREAYFGI